MVNAFFCFLPFFVSQVGVSCDIILALVEKLEKEDGILTNISEDTVLKVANLAKLEVSNEEAGTFATQLDKIIEMVEKLNELDTQNVEPTSHAIDVSNVLREDVAKPGLKREKVLRNAPDTQDGMFKVPTIIEE